MSNEQNTNILEQAAELIDELPETDLSERLISAVESNDLDEVYWLLKTYCKLCGNMIGANCNNARCI